MYVAKKRPWLPWLAGFGLLSGLTVMVGLMGSALSPFVTAAVLAYILAPLVERLCRRGLSRSLAAMAVMSATFLLILLLLLIVIPMLVDQFGALMARLPATVSFIQNKLLPAVNQYFETDLVLDGDSVTVWLHNNVEAVRQSLSKALPALAAQGGQVVMVLSNLVLLPFLLYYFLLDWADWNRGLKTLVPRRYIGTFNRVSGKMDRVLSQFMRGQLTVMLMMGLLYGVGLVLVGLDSGFAIGMVAGLLVFIPYLGAFIGLLLASLAALIQFGSWPGMLSVWAVFAVGQFLESFFITPKIVGESIGLSPFWVIFALMAFGTLFGFVGMLLALPLAAVTSVLLRECLDQYLGSRFYRQLQR